MTVRGDDGCLPDVLSLCCRRIRQRAAAQQDCEAGQKSTVSNHIQNCPSGTGDRIFSVASHAELVRTLPSNQSADVVEPVGESALATQGTPHNPYYRQSFPGCLSEITGLAQERGNLVHKRAHRAVQNSGSRGPDVAEWRRSLFMSLLPRSVEGPPQKGRPEWRASRFVLSC